MQHEQLKAFVLDKIDDMKGRDIVELNVKGKSTVTDTMVICSGNSKRHVSSIA
ncbi:MAG TPA: ribosome silencing factor RsfS, partial [Alteromonas sp.]|nr:ribosome silencing factor RsfS [Alteromonas sp.]